MRNAATQVKSERKKREGADKELRAAHEARTAAAAAAARAQEQLQAQQGDLDRWQRLAEERAGLVVRAENAACEMRQACDKQVRAEAYPRRGATGVVSASCLAAACMGALPAWSACSACVVWLLKAAQLAGDLVVRQVHEDGCMGALQLRKLFDDVSGCGHMAPQKEVADPPRASSMPPSHVQGHVAGCGMLRP